MIDFSEPLHYQRGSSIVAARAIFNDGSLIVKSDDVELNVGDLVFRPSNGQRYRVSQPSRIERPARITAWKIEAQLHTNQ
jgi:hypothetical protein